MGRGENKPHGYQRELNGLLRRSDKAGGPGAVTGA